jgi:hypothetical protein
VYPWQTGPGGQVPLYHARQVVKVDEDLINTRTAELVEPDIQQRPAIDRHHAFRSGVRDRPQPAADPGG